ncbi:HAD family hydrolase [Flavobacteriaceae bacterium SZ-1-7]|uniref:HAD family hydrolase n=1 Tax=Tamlana sedimenti TaxID=3134126 RepID=UPI00312614D7
MILKISNTVVVFDLDDTLYNEIDFLKSAYKAIACKLEKDNWQFLYAHMLSIYRNKKDVFGFLSERYLVEKKCLLNEYREHVPKLKPFGHVIAFLKKIKQMGGKVAIITDGREKTQKNKLNSLGIDKYLDLLVVSETIGTEKPNENNYKIVESCYPNHDYIYIGDNYKKDFITPNIRKWTTIGIIDNGLNVHNNFFKFSSSEKHIPSYFINSYSEILLINN